MYYVPDGTEKCGYYECKECGARFLDSNIVDEKICPYCEKEVDAEIGPDEVMETGTVLAKLLKVIEGKEEIEKWDKLLSLAITGGDEEWI